MATYTPANIIIPHDSQQSVATWFAARYPLPGQIRKGQDFLYTF